MTDTSTRKGLAERISGAIDRAVEIVCAIALGSMTIVVLLGVFFRYVLNSPLNWAEETSRYLMIWGASLGISLGISSGEHVGLTVILDSMKSPKARLAMTLLIDAIVFAFLAFMLVYSLQVTAESKMQMTQALGISMFIPRLAVPLAMGLSALQVILAAIKACVSLPAAKGGPSYIDI